MRAYNLTHLDDVVLLRELTARVACECVATADVVALIAEVDARQLYGTAAGGYPSMHAYCVGELRLSEDCAYKRIQAARVARRVPRYSARWPTKAST